MERERDLDFDLRDLFETLGDSLDFFSGDLDFSLIRCEFDEKSSSRDPALLLKGEGTDANS